VALILDTGVIVALLNANDDHHQACLQLVQNTHEPLVVPAAALFEVDYWLRTRSAFEAWEIFVEDIDSGAYLLAQTTEEDLVRIVQLERQYQDLDLDFVDAAVIALCERMREPKVATIDKRDFRIVVPRHVDALELLPH